MADAADAPEGARAPATDAAAALLAELNSLGVTHVVVSPGSRSQALALVAAELEARELAQVHVRIDERVAGFTALGLARETGLPAAVICTSGTAVANLLPAVLEAHHSGVPLLLLTADRPPELRGVGANQTTRQPGMFSPYVRFEADLPVPDRIDPDGTGAASAAVRAAARAAFGASRGAGAGAAGPVHLNLPYREPLAGALPPWAARLTAAATAPPAPVADAPPASAAAPPVSAAAAPPVSADAPPASADATPPASAAEAPPAPADATSPASADATPPAPAGDAPPASAADAPVTLPRGPRTVVVAGAGAGPDAEALAHEGGWPLVAEIVSGARFGRRIVHSYRALLADAELGGRIERAVVYGHPTLSREVVALLSRRDVDVVAVRGPGEPLNLNGATRPADAVAVAPGDIDRPWLADWLRASHAAAVDLTPAAPDADGLSSAEPHRRLGAISAELEVIRAPLDRVALVDAVWRASWPHDRLFFASSRLVRVADAVLGGKRVPVHANRGLAGIDGTVATATGVAIASQADGAPGVTRLLTGDLALLHDVGALLLPPGEPEPRLQVIVGNDGGGTIFDGLEVAAVASAAAMERVLYTPQSARLEQLAAAYGWEYRRATTRTELDQALTSPVAGRQLIEVPLGR